MRCEICKGSPVQQLRGYWEDLPAESPNRTKFAPPEVVEAKFWAVALVVVVGVFVAISSLWVGLLIALGGLLRGAWMSGQVKAYRMRLADYNARKICLVEYHTFIPVPILETDV
ncbi:hypothetical protein ACFYYI_26610 [Streptomyces sp. NPDC002387]|uniref:hypothetical protein n=1 Tax=unclassified Streptomyces TaxID=2593676 RepID=UPI0036969D10